MYFPLWILPTTKEPGQENITAPEVFFYYSIFTFYVFLI